MLNVTTFPAKLIDPLSGNTKGMATATRLIMMSQCTRDSIHELIRILSIRFVTEYSQITNLRIKCKTAKHYAKVWVTSFVFFSWLNAFVVRFFELPPELF